MKRLLRLVFNRWTLLAVLLLALGLLIWVVGPLVAVGDVRPLDTVPARAIAIAAILGLVAAWLAAAAWRARRGNAAVVDQLVAAPTEPMARESADMASVRERFERAMVTLKRAKFGATAGAARGPAGVLAGWAARLNGRYLYELPWYLIIGAPGSGKTTALRNAGLRFPLSDTVGDDAVRGVGGTRHCDWWFTDQAVLIDTAGRFTTQDSDRDNDRATWTGFLSMLKTSRPRQPLNGVLVTVSVTDLLTRSTAERVRHAATVRQRLQELHEQLHIRFPIYLLVTKCDLMAGFGETFGALDKDQRATPWGFTFPLNGSPAREAAGAAGMAAAATEFDALLHRLHQGLIDRLQAEPDAQRRARVYGFPGQFAALRGALLEFAEAVFQPSVHEPAPLLRGMYFVSGTQEGTPIDRMLASTSRRLGLERAVLPPQRAAGRSYFLQRLLGEVVFAEHGIASTDLTWERRRTALVLAGYAVVGLLSVATVAAWGVSYANNRAYVAAVADRVDGVRRLVQATPNRATPDLLPVMDALEATRALAAAGSAPAPSDVPWTLGFGLFQGGKLDGAAKTAYDRMLIDAVLPRLALRIEEQLRAGDAQDSQYEALKAYLMMYDPERFDAAALRAHIEADWSAHLGREVSEAQRQQLDRHLDALLAQGAAVSPLPQDRPLVEATRTKLSLIGLPQRVYDRMRQRGLGADYPEFTIAKAGGPNAMLVFARASGAPLTRGVPGLYSHAGYHQGFQSQVQVVTNQLAEEQPWVLGIEPGVQTAAVRPADNLLGDPFTDDVRRIYLTEYADTWQRFIADIRTLPMSSISQSVQMARLLSAPDNPLVPLMRAISRETTLLGAQGAVDKAGRQLDQVMRQGQATIAGMLGRKPATSGAPGERIESIVDDRFARLRSLVTAPEGGKAQIDAVVARIGEVHLLLTAVETAVASKSAPPPSPLPNQVKAEASTLPEPVRGLLLNLSSSSAQIAQMQVRGNLADEVRSQVGEFCLRAAAGRYPIDPNSARDLTQADFATLFAPGGKMDQLFQQKLAPYVDTSTRPWKFKPVDGTPLGPDSGSLPQFQRAAAIRETFFASGAGGFALRLEFKPVEMDPGLTQFILDVDGQVVRYAHGPQIPTTVTWPGPRGSGQVRMQVSPAGTGMVNEGPWALLRLFDRVRIDPGAAPEKFRATFDADGRKAVFDVTTSSVRNPFRLPELREFSCPTGL